MDNDAWKNCELYLVFNNVIQTFDDKEMGHGLLIKITEGMIMSFQGNTLWHGTTICQNALTGELCPHGDIYGIHFGLSLPKLNSLHQVHIDQYIREMNVIPKMIICEHVDSIKVKDMSSLAMKRKKIRLLFENKRK